MVSTLNIEVYKKSTFFQHQFENLFQNMILEKNPFQSNAYYQYINKSFNHSINNLLVVQKIQMKSQSL